MLVGCLKNVCPGKWDEDAAGRKSSLYLRSLSETPVSVGYMLCDHEHLL